MIKSVIVHLHNELPILVDLFDAPEAHAQTVTCTNVRGVDGKRPTFVHDPKSFAPNTKMTFSGIKRDPDRANVLDFLHTLSDNPKPLPPP